MDAHTHAWIAVRAIALLDDTTTNPPLVTLLKKHATSVISGTWLPDKGAGGSAGYTAEQHVFQIMPLPSPADRRFICKKDELVHRLAGMPALRAFIQKDQTLNENWWNQGYKGEASPGKHLPNRIMGLATMLRDLIPFGDDEINGLLEKPASCRDGLCPNVMTSADQLVFYLFMLSHYVSDTGVPCHADGRDYVSRYDGIHHKLEQSWSKLVGNNFEEAGLKAQKLDIDILIQKAKERDSIMGISFGNQVGDIKKDRDVWMEGMDFCRASFALMAILANPEKYPYEQKPKGTYVPFEEIFGDHKSLLNEVSRICLSDAVYNTAMIWQHVWKKATKMAD